MEINPRQQPLLLGMTGTTSLETAQKPKREMQGKRLKIIDIRIKQRRFSIELIDGSATFSIIEWKREGGKWKKEFNFYAYSSAVAIEIWFVLIQTAVEEQEDLKIGRNFSDNS